MPSSVACKLIFKIHKKAKCLFSVFLLKKAWRALILTLNLALGVMLALLFKKF